MEGNYMILKSFEEKLLNLYGKNSSSEEILDYIFNTIDDMLMSGEFCKCDYLLNNINTSELKPLDIVGILTITFPYKSDLTFRCNFYDSCEPIILKSYTVEESSQILTGLR